MRKQDIKIGEEYANRWGRRLKVIGEPYRHTSSGRCGPSTTWVVRAQYETYPSQREEFGEWDKPSFVPTRDILRPWAEEKAELNAARSARDKLIGELDTTRRERIEVAAGIVDRLAALGIEDETQVVIEPPLGKLFELLRERWPERTEVKNLTRSYYRNRFTAPLAAGILTYITNGSLIGVPAELLVELLGSQS